MSDEPTSLMWSFPTSLLGYLVYNHHNYIVNDSVKFEVVQPWLSR